MLFLLPRKPFSIETSNHAHFPSVTGLLSAPEAPCPMSALSASEFFLKPLSIPFFLLLGEIPPVCYAVFQENDLRQQCPDLCIKTSIWHSAAACSKTRGPRGLSLLQGTFSAFLVITVVSVASSRPDVKRERSVPATSTSFPLLLPEPFHLSSVTTVWLELVFLGLPSRYMWKRSAFLISQHFTVWSSFMVKWSPLVIPLPPVRKYTTRTCLQSSFNKMTHADSHLSNLSFLLSFTPPTTSKPYSQSSCQLSMNS